ncbi:MAG: helix-turn-helix domain-containing protein, partial [Nitrososphaerales archaeon]
SQQLPKKEVIEQAYRQEKDANVSRRILLALKVRYEGIPASHIARDVHRHKSWTTPWLRRFDKEGLEGLKTRQRSGRPPKLDRQTFVRVKRKVVKSECGWSVKEVREMIRAEANVVYTERHVLRLLQRWGVRAVVPDKRLLHKASREERMAFKKERKSF